MPQISALNIYPIKSCGGIAVSEARAAARGFEGDRRYMVVDMKGRFVTQRQFPKLALVDIERVAGGFRVSAPDCAPLDLPDSISAGRDGAGLCEVKIWQQQLEATLAPADVNVWFSELLGFACGLAYMADDQHRAVTNDAAHFDDEVSFADGAPYLLLSDATLAGLNARLERPVSMSNFRPNIVVTADTPHAEDEWTGFAAGSAKFAVGWSCSRCVLTTVDPERGVRRDDGEPLKTLRSYRSENGVVLFGQNLLLRQAGTVAVGDAVELEPESR